MITRKKMIVFSIFALTIGISSIIPVGYFLVTSAQLQTFNESWFDVVVPYSYWEPRNGTFEDWQYPETIYFNETEVESLGHLTLLNFTLKKNIDTQDANARIEYFIIKLSSDIGLIEKEYEFIGTTFNPSFGFGDFKFSRNGWFDTSDMGGGGLLDYNMTKGESRLWANSGGGTNTIDKNSPNAKIRQANELYVTVYRLGMVTFLTNSTIVTSANNEIVAQVQLERYGQGWLYNEIISEDELSQINLWEPVDWQIVNK